MQRSKRVPQYGQVVSLIDAFHDDDARKNTLDQASQLDREFRFMQPAVMQTRTFANNPTPGDLYRAAYTRTSLDDSMAKRMIQSGDGRVEFWQNLGTTQDGRPLFNKGRVEGEDAASVPQMIARQVRTQAGEPIRAAVQHKKEQLATQLLTLLLLGVLVAGTVVVVSRNA